MAKLSDAEIRRDLKEKPTVPIDPHVAWAFDCSRNRAYQLAREDKEMFLHIGSAGKRPMLRGISSVIRKRLGIESAL
jgi:hypothetical protein